jgi:biopolymer transport protein ExbD
VAEVGRITLSLGRQRKHPIKITFVPLVDCFIILLIFFMLQSSFVVPHGIALSSSKKEENKPVGSTTAESTLVYVELHKNGEVWLDGQKIALDELAARLPRVNGEGKPVVIATDPGVLLQRAVDVIDVANSRGYFKVSLREAQQFK